MKRDRTSGAALIAAERCRQIDIEGWTAKHDDIYDSGELLDAAVDYVESAHTPEISPPPRWPWARSYWKLSRDPVRNLVKAGALIAAEIDRLQRQANKKGRAA